MSFKHEVAPPQRGNATQYNNADALTQALGAQRSVTVNVDQFVRTRDALTSAYINLSQSIDQAVKAYLNHTQTIINGDGALNATLLIEPFNSITHTAQQVAQQALRAQGNDSIDPQLLQNGQVSENGDGKKKRKKRAYKQRDPNAPKRPLTAYFRFLGEQRPGIMEEVKKDPAKFEEAGKPGDISKIATKRWNALTEAQQLPYKQAYQDALKGYEKEVEEYKKLVGQNVEDSKIDVDGAEIDPELDADADVDADAEGEDDVDATAVAGAADEKDSDEDEKSDSSEAEDEEEASDDSDDEPAAPPPKPSKKAAATPKSALKKGAKQAQTFSSKSDPPAATPAPPKEASPAKKRKAAAEPEDTTKSSKKKSRKSTVTAGADPVASSVPAPAAVASSPPATSDKAAKKAAKKDKKKRKSSAGEA